LLEDEIDRSEILLEEMNIHNKFFELKEKFSDLNKFSFKIEYNKLNKNFWALIEFCYSTADEEEDIY